jgi:hypothetical protein
MPFSRISTKLKSQLKNAVKELGVVIEGAVEKIYRVYILYLNFLEL